MLHESSISEFEVRSTRSHSQANAVSLGDSLFFNDLQYVPRDAKVKEATNADIRIYKIHYGFDSTRLGSYFQFIMPGSVHSGSVQRFPRFEFKNMCS